jgi:hypothetical protein
MPTHSFPAIDALIKDIESFTEIERDSLSAMMALIRLAVSDDTDPYLLAGTLVEGIAATLQWKIPEAQQREVAVETLRLLMLRFEERGLI